MVSDNGLVSSPFKQGPTLEKSLKVLTKFLALVGGVGLIALVLMSLYSLISRKFGLGGLKGDIELMEVSVAVCIAAFMPYCTLRGEHLKVTFFTEKMKSSFQKKVDFIVELLLAVVALGLTWRTAMAAIDLYEIGEVTTLLSLPLWIPVSFLVPSLFLTSLCGFYRFLGYGNKEEL